MYSTETNLLVFLYYENIMVLEDLAVIWTFVMKKKTKLSFLIDFHVGKIGLQCRITFYGKVFTNAMLSQYGENHFITKLKIKM